MKNKFYFDDGAPMGDNATATELINLGPQCFDQLGAPGIVMSTKPMPGEEQLTRGNVASITYSDFDPADGAEEMERKVVTSMLGKLNAMVPANG